MWVFGGLRGKRPYIFFIVLSINTHAEFKIYVMGSVISIGRLILHDSKFRCTIRKVRANIKLIIEDKSHTNPPLKTNL